jgi:hypothetical protein
MDCGLAPAGMADRRLDAVAAMGKDRRRVLLEKTGCCFGHRPVPFLLEDTRNAESEFEHCGCHFGNRRRFGDHAMLAERPPPPARKGQLSSPLSHYRQGDGRPPLGCWAAVGSGVLFLRGGGVTAQA